MKYFAQIGFINCEKNKLEKAISTYVRMLDRTLINNDERLKTFIGDIKKAVLQLYHENKRCKRIEVSENIYSGDKIILYISHLSIEITAIKNEIS